MMMDPSGLMPYDSRATSLAPMQRPSMAPQYMMGNSYSMAPVNSMAAPHYPAHNPFNFNSYPSPSPAPMAPPYRQYPDERPALRLMPTENERGQAVTYAKDGRAIYADEHSPSPSIKSEGNMGARKSSVPTSATGSKTITPNIVENEDNQVAFHTNVDNLMKAIQSKDDQPQPKPNEPVEASFQQQQQPLPPPPPPQPQQAPSHQQQQPSPVIEPKSEMDMRSSSPEDLASAGGQEGKDSRKRYMCDIKGCNKRFAQKTHLDIHRRAHTGEKPYRCTQPGCGQRFSQLGNLKTHERRHTGEKPYQCDICGKSFAQRGNVRAHKEVHNPLKRFHCKLDDCQKRFSQLGNLKSHQNKFHAATLKTLTTKFASIRPEDNITNADRELFAYFAELYKNSNKGIKGRGKDRKVGAVSQSPSSATIPSQYPLQHTSPMHHTQQHLPHPGHHGLAHPGGLSHYTMSRGAPGHSMMVGRDPRGYEMFDVDQESISGSHPASSTSGTMYEEDHGRELAFGERMY